MFKPFPVDQSFNGIRFSSSTAPFRPLVIPVDQFFPESAARLHFVVPADVMEPEQVIIGNACDVLKDGSDGFMVLGYGI